MTPQQRIEHCNNSIASCTDLLAIIEDGLAAKKLEMRRLILEQNSVEKIVELNKQIRNCVAARNELRKEIYNIKNVMRYHTKKLSK